MAALGLRVLVTSRPEVPVRLWFHSMTHVAYHQLALREVDRAIVDRGITQFVVHELANIKANRNLPDYWPGDDKIQTITSQASGFFLYATTVCRYVNGPRQVSACARLNKVCQGYGAKYKSTEALDEMYLTTLDSSMKGDFSTDEAQEVTLRLRQVVGSVVLLLDNLSAEELARLLFATIPTGALIAQETLDLLYAVFDVPEDRNKPIKMQQLYFLDFLLDSARCPDARFHINQQQAHHDLSECCLGLMRRHLGQNTCQLASQGTFVREVSEATLKQYLPF